MSRPHITVTDAQRAEVETLAAVLNAEQIADFLGIGRTTFFALLNRDEDLAERYRRGKARSVGAVAQSLVTSARAGNVTAMIFFLKTQGGWRETMHVAPARPVSAAPAQIDASLLSDQALVEIIAAMDATSRPPALEAKAEGIEGGADGQWSVP